MAESGHHNTLNLDTTITDTAPEKTDKMNPLDSDIRKEDQEVPRTDEQVDPSIGQEEEEEQDVAAHQERGQKDDLDASVHQVQEMQRDEEKVVGRPALSESKVDEMLHTLKNAGAVLKAEISEQLRIAEDKTSKLLNLSATNDIKDKKSKEYIDGLNEFEKLWLEAGELRYKKESLEAALAALNRPPRSAEEIRADIERQREQNRLLKEAIDAARRGDADF